ncbi:translocation/assembly module TamB domain-containing protein [bacterium]|nr:translocation/assembly module TamB domain-containing protein [bacterium]
MKKKILFSLLILIFLLTAGLLIINLPSTKQKVGAYLIDYLKKEYGIHAETDQFDYKFQDGLLIVRIDKVKIFGGKTNQDLFFQSKFLEVEIPYSSLWRDHFLVQNLVLSGPDVNPENLPQLRERPQTKSEKTFEIQKIDLRDGILRYGRMPLKEIELQAKIQNNNLVLQTLKARFDTITIEGSGELKNLSDPHYQLNYKAAGNLSAVQKILADAPPLKGEFTTEGKASGETGSYVVEGKLRSDHLSVYGEQPFTAGGTFRFDSANTAVPLNLSVQWDSAPAGLARRFDPDLPQLASVTQGSVTYLGGKDFWQGLASFELDLVQAAGRGIPVAGRVSGRLNDGAIHIEKSHLSTGSAQATFEGQLTQSQMLLDLDANVKNAASLAFVSPEMRKIPGSYFVRSRIQGPYKNLQVQWDLKGTAPDVQIVSTGAYRMAANQIQATFQGNADAKVLARFYPAKLQGNITFEGKASGYVMSPVLTAEVQGTGLNVNGTEIGEATLDLESDGRILNAEAQIPAYSTVASGKYTFKNRNFEFETHSDQLDLATLRPFLPPTAQEAQGTFTASITAAGNARKWQDADAHVMLEKADFKYRAYGATIKLATADLQQRTVTVNLDTQTTHGNVQVRGTVPVFRKGEMDLDVTGQTDMKFVSLFQPKLQAEGPVNINVHLGGTFSKPDYSGRAAAEQFAVISEDPPVELKQANMAADFSGAEIGLRGTGILNGATLSIDGNLPLVRSAGFVHLTLDNLSLATLTTQTEADVRGNISIDMDAHGIGRDPETWSGFFKIVPSQVIVSGHSIETPEPLEVEMTSGKMFLNKIHLKSGAVLDTEAQGQVNFRTGQVEGLVRSSIEMSLLSGFMTDAAAEGKLRADIHVAGTTKSPDFEGLIQIENGMFRKFQSPLLLEQIQLRAPLHKDGIRIENLTARMGGGTIEGSGEIMLTNWAPKDIDLQVAARRVGMNYPDAFRSQLNADLTMKNVNQDFLISGKVQVIRSTYRDDIDPRDRLVNSLLSQKTDLSPQAAAQGRIRLDIAVETLEDFQMRNNMGKIQAAANLEVKGLMDEPRLSGRVRVRERSEITFEGNQFEVQRGNIDFYGQRKIDPVFDVELFTIATDTDTQQDYEITIPLSGPLSDLDRRDPTSFPPLAPNQIYFLLLTGKADVQISAASGRFFDRQLGAFLSGGAFSNVQQKIARSFGLNRVEIQPELVSSELNPGAKLVLGKDFTSSLSLVYSVSLTESDDQTWIANYKAPKNVSFRFVDQQQGYTANLRHLIRFGRGQSTGKLQDLHRVRKRKVESLEIENDSLLTDQEISKEIGLEIGDTYDFWTVQDELEKLEETLQERDVLFSSTEAEEKEVGSDRVALKVKVTGKERRQMIFEGYNVSSSQLEKFQRFWREGFSPEGVTEIIRENLLRDLWLEGYHKTEVRKETSTPDGIIQHRFLIQPGALYTDTQIKFVGAEQYPTTELEEDFQALYPGRAEMSSDAVHNFQSLERKIVALYVRRGFLDSSVELGRLQLTAPQAIKEITVHEGTQSKIVDIVISDNQELPEDLMKLLKLKKGMVHDQALLIEDEVTIGDFYERLGYINAEVESSVKKVEGGLIVKYDLKKGGVAIVDSIDIQGPEFTSQKLITKRLQLKEGEILNQDKLANAQKNLTDLRIFHQVTVRPQSTDTPDRYRVVVDVIERNHYELTYGFRYDTETDLGGEVQLTDLNLFGSGQSISFYTRIHQKDQLYRIVYHSPTLSGLRWKTLISTSYESGDLLLLEDEKLDGERFDLTFQRQKELRDQFILIPGFQFEYLTVTPVEEDSNIEPVEGLKVSRFIGTLLRDTRDDPFNAKRGSFFSSDLQYAPGFIGDVSYLKSFNQYLRFRPVGKYLWASALRLGLATDLPGRIVTERFFAGGSYTVRGFKKDQVGPELPDGTPAGGEALFVLNQEFRFPIWKWFGGAVFYDAGNVYSGVGDFNPFDLRHSIGPGLRLNSPFGIARLDYGINISPEDDEPRGVLHFALGQAF